MDETSVNERYSDLSELEKYKSIRAFKNRVGESTWERYVYHLRDFFQWLANQPDYGEYTPDSLIKEAKKMTRQEQYDLVDMLIEYRKDNETRGLRGTSIKTRVSVARSFFKHNRCELPSDELMWKVSPETPPVLGELTPKDVKEMILSMNPTYQAIYTSMFQSGMDLDCFVRWNESGWQNLKEALDNGDTIHEIPVHGRKKTKNIKTFYTYIGKDSLNKIREYAEKHRKKYAPKDGTHIFYTQKGQPVTKNSVYLMWHRHLASLGKITLQGSDHRNRYGMNPHELRDVFVTQFQKSPAGEPAGQYFTGHIGDSNEYAKAYEQEDFRKTQYKAAEPWISLFSSDLSLGLVRAEQYEERIRSQSDVISSMGVQLEALKAEMAMIKQVMTEPHSLTQSEQVQAFEAMGQEDVRIFKGRAPDGKQVREEESDKQ